MIDWSVLGFGNLAAATISGLLSGLWLAYFHPPLYGDGQVRRAALQGWFFVVPFSILYGARLGFSLTSGAADGPRLIAAWILSMLFTGWVGLGAYAGNRMRLWWAHRRCGGVG